ncbi:Carbon-monoxide dehydrogenase medium subunit/2-furoyl-CoA dehydrogenase FAD binding subunit [Burkholderiales bacterium 8X]|nr:Carbon-monoxide dehydrogenase medium subunit/2-furoyl-CoA dehydrogenase FAD binding subunit [Burkholderiales bacterium 8X]
MKAAPFDYVRAESLDHVLECLARHGMDAKAIAGGQSLVPMMAMRLARPAVLVDINCLPELKQVAIEPTHVAMGATTRQRDVEDDQALCSALPLVRQALRWVGHVQTRNRGTVGGSMVHADPSAELPLAAKVLGATLRLRSQDGGERVLAADEFFLGPMFTAVGETECLVEIEWPVWQGAGVVSAFDETAMRSGDFAMASAACQLQVDADGICRRAAFGLGGVDGIPLSFPDLAAQLVGQRIDATSARELAHAAADRAEPGSDLHADADYRRHLGAVLLARTLQRAAAGATAAAH